MGKEHLNKKKNYIALPFYKGYYIDKVYRKICYKNNKGEWMYSKKVEDKKGFVYIYSEGIQVSINEIAIVHSVIGEAPITETPKEDDKDKRYKDNVDTGHMSKQKVGIPLKKKPIEKKEYDDTPKQVLRQKLAKATNNQRRHRKGTLLQNQTSEGAPQGVAENRNLGPINGSAEDSSNV